MSTVMETEAPDNLSQMDHILRLVQINAFGLYLQTAAATASPEAKQLHRRMCAPQVGDLVLEITAIRDDTYRRDRLGRLLEIVREPMFTPAELARMSAEGMNIDQPHYRYTETVRYVESMDGRKMRWVAVDMIAVATDFGFLNAPRDTTEKGEGE